MARPLDEVLEQLLLEGEALMLEAQRRSSVSGLRGPAAELARRYRAIGTCLLLLDADPDAFFHWLVQSALARRHFLRQCEKEARADEPERSASRLEGFLDAVAASQWKLAGEIATLSAHGWMKGEEYQDDFAYGRFLQLAAQDRPDPGAMRDALDLFEGALEGGEAVRLDLSRALLARDQAAFDAAFDELLAEHERTTTEILDSDSALAQDVCFEPGRLVMVEGLALLRLAERNGLETRAEYPFCPGAARLPSYAPFEPIAWPGTAIDA